MNDHTSPWRTNRNRAADLPLTLEDSMRNPPRGKNTGGTSRRRFLTMTAGMTASLPLVSVRESAADEQRKCRNAHFPAQPPGAIISGQTCTLLDSVVMP